MRYIHGFRGPSYHITVLLLTAVTLALAATGCETMSYPAVQRDFEVAVRAETMARLGEQPYTPMAETHYREVFETLTPEYIAKLDARLQPNAWLLRGFAALGDPSLDRGLEEARAAGRNGQAAEPVAGSRDDVLLAALDGVVLQTEVERHFRTDGLRDPNVNISASRYEDIYQPNFKAAYEILTRAEGRATGLTPDSVRYYLTYRQALLLRNWHVVIGQIAGSSDVRNAARQDAERFVGEDSLEEAPRNRIKRLSADHSYRILFQRISG